MIVTIERHICFYAAPAQQEDGLLLDMELPLPDEPCEGQTPITIKVDLDGTIAESLPQYQEDKIGPPRPGAKEVLSRWKENGWRIIINTVRGNHAVVESYLREHGIPFDWINYNPDQPPNSSHKIYADIDVDDTAVDADQPWEEIDRAVHRKLRRQGKINECLLEHCALDKLAADSSQDEFAPGIKDRFRYGDPKQFAGDEATFLIQRHLALRAGPHYDIRFGGPEGLFSWATRKEWPAEPAKILLFQQPIHSWSYKDFEGTIPPPKYGAGQVRKQLETRMKVLRRGKRSLTFSLPDHLPHMEYTLVELPQQPEARRQVSRPWLLLANVARKPETSVEVVPRRSSYKRPIGRQEAEQLKREAIRQLEPYVLHVSQVGSMLRHPEQESFGDVDLLAVPKEEIPSDLRRNLAQQGVDLYTADMASFEPSLLHWGVGKQILRLKNIAKAHKMRLNRYGLWKKDKEGQWRLVETDAEKIFRRLKNLDPSLGEFPSFLQEELERFRNLRKGASLQVVCRRCGRWPEDCLCQASAMILEPYWKAGSSKWSMY